MESYYFPNIFERQLLSNRSRHTNHNDYDVETAKLFSPSHPQKKLWSKDMPECYDGSNYGFRLETIDPTAL